MTEEFGWMCDQQNVLKAYEEPLSFAAAENILTKYEAFKTEFNVHKKKLIAVDKLGQDLIKKVSFSTLCF